MPGAWSVFISAMHLRTKSGRLAAPQACHERTTHTHEEMAAQRQRPRRGVSGASRKRMSSRQTVATKVFPSHWCLHHRPGQAPKRAAKPNPTPTSRLWLCSVKTLLRDRSSNMKKIKHPLFPILASGNMPNWQKIITTVEKRRKRRKSTPVALSETVAGGDDSPLAPSPHTRAV